MGREDLAINFYRKRKKKKILLDYKTKGILFIYDNII